MALKKDEEEERLLFVGAAHADSNYNAQGPVIPGHTCLATSTRSFGGCAYNAAKIVSDLGTPTGIITAIGDDSVSPLILRNLEKQGIAVVAAIFIPGSHTASYVAIHDENGEMRLGAIVDDIYHRVSVDMFAKHIEKIQDYAALVCDTSLSAEIYAYLFSAVPAALDIYTFISSLNSAEKISPLLSRCKGLFGNVDEINHLARNYDVSEAGIWRSLEILEEKGVEGIFATHGTKGVYALVAGERYQLKAHAVEKIVSVHGAGDTFAAAVVYNLRQGKAVQQAIDAGLAAAALKIQAKEINHKTLQEAIVSAAENHKKQSKAGKLLFKLQTI